MRVYVHGAMRAQGTDSFEGVSQPVSFKGVFWTDTIESISDGHRRRCACMRVYVHGSWLFPH